MLKVKEVTEVWSKLVNNIFKLVVPCIVIQCE